MLGHLPLLSPTSLTSSLPDSAPFINFRCTSTSRLTLYHPMTAFSSNLDLSNPRFSLHICVSAQYIPANNSSPHRSCCTTVWSGVTVSPQPNHRFLDSWIAGFLKGSFSGKSTLHIFAFFLH